MLKATYRVELILFSTVFIIYCLCLSNTINFWDSPEFIASSYTLQASHPPGSPLYTLLSGLLLSFFSAENVALVSNVISAFFGALAVVMVYKITFKISKLNLSTSNNSYVKQLPLLSGLLAALSFAFSTSFWTASIETEVYTMSFALLATMIYVLLKWYASNSEKKRRQLFVIFFFLLGISVSVHLILISIVIPASVLFVYKTYNAQIKHLIFGIFAGILVFFSLYSIVIKGTIKLAAVTDIFFVNSLELPVNYGALCIAILVIAFLTILYLVFKKIQRQQLQLLCLVIGVFLLGSSTCILPLLRSEVNTLVAEKVDTTNRLEEYISAQRFGVDNIPLIYGPTYNAQLDNSRPFINTKPTLTYDADAKKYVEAHDGVSNKINYSFKFKSVFPRMYDAKNASNYAAWTTIKGKEIAHKVNGEIQNFSVPTFTENLGFFINYQILWLNTRYLFWNFIGRQNDHHGLGYIKDGNWASGFNALDKHRIGDQSKIPQHYKNNKGNDHYYFLPFILGLIGFIGLLKRKDLSLFLLLLFLTFGIGITIYVNPLPSSILIRERDYIFIGSFLIFSIWIGLSLVTIAKVIQKYSDKTPVLIATTLLVFLASPIQLFAKGLDNHKNNNDNFAYNFGKSYLDACPKQAILITNGDNMTFPLWYLQEVEGYRTDVRVINFDQLNIDTHIDNLKKKKHQSEAITIDLNKRLYINGTEKIIPFQKETEAPINLEVLTQFLNAEKTLTNWNGRMRHYVPGSTFTLSIDTTNTYFKSFVSKTYDASVVPKLTWSYSQDFYSLNSMVVYNIIKNNFSKRPICFANNSKTSHLVGLSPYLFHNGMVSELLPLVRNKTNSNPKLVNTQHAYQLLVAQPHFEIFNSETSYVKDENRTYARDILRQNYYFLAQALFEEQKIDQAKNTIEKCLQLYPNSEVPYKQYAFALGRLYYRMGLNDLGNQICKKAMNNIWKELMWITSFDTPNPIINARHAKKLLNMYQQMTNQIYPYNKLYAEGCNLQLKKFVNTYNVWYKNNWPYSIN